MPQAHPFVCNQTIQAIYPEFVSGILPSLTLEILIELPEGCGVTVTAPVSQQLPSLQDVQFVVSALPPIILDVRLPQGYPISSPPSISSIHVTHAWIPDTSRISEALLSMWTPEEPVLTAWIEWISGASFLDTLGVRQTISDTSVMQCVPPFFSPF